MELKQNKMRSLIDAIRYDDVDAVRMHIGAMLPLKVTQPGCGETTVLHEAVSCRSRRVTSFLLKAGLDVNSRDFRGVPPIFKANGPDCLEMMKELVESGADVKARDNEENSVLHALYIPSVEKVVEYLVGRGADVNAKNCRGVAPLHISFYNYEVAACKELLRLGADSEARTNTGCTPLMRACLHLSVNLIPVFIELGANVEARSLDGDTPLDFLISSNDEVMGDYSDSIRLLSDRLDFVVRKRRICRTFMACVGRFPHSPFTREMVEDIMERVVPTQTE